MLMNNNVKYSVATFFPLQNVIEGNASNIQVRSVGRSMKTDTLNKHIRCVETECQSQMGTYLLLIMFLF